MAFSRSDATFRARGRHLVAHAEEDKEEGVGGTSADLLLVIEASEFAFKSCVCLRCIRCRLVDMTFDALKINPTFVGKFGTLN